MSANKAHRKTRRVTEKVKNQFGIEILESASQYILICNAGLMNGATYEDLAKLLLQFGSSLLDIQFVPEQSYSFASFASIDHSENVYENIHGKLGLVDDSPLYMAFVNQLPQIRNGSLIWDKSKWPSGLKVVEDFVTDDEEKTILDSLIFEENPKTDLKHRKVIHYKHDFVYGSNTIDATKDNGRDFPKQWKPFLNRIMDEKLIKINPDQCTVNRYEPGQGIPPHIDTHSCCNDTILSLSLGSNIVMNFKCLDSGDQFPVVLPKRSLLIMSGEARYKCSHGITPRTSDVVPLDNGKGLTLIKRGLRTSLTFRKTLQEPCSCEFAAYCDSQKKNQELNDDLAKELEATHVHCVYEKIADHFSETRHTPWPQVVEFISSLPDNSVLLDIGCGNGKYLGSHKNQLQIGCDYSNGLISICRERGFNGVRSDCLALPFKSNSADGIICIAVIHHLATEERRIRAVEEMKRVLTPEGRALIYAWAKNQHKEEKPSTYLKANKKIDETHNNIPATKLSIDLPVHTNRTHFQYSDLLVPWNLKGNDPKTFHRFYHVFEEGELENMILKVNDIIIEKSYYDQGNWCVIFKKI